MGNNSIAKASLSLSVDGGELTQGLDNASKQVSGWKDKVTKTIDKAALPKSASQQVAPGAAGQANGGGGAGMLAGLGKAGPYALAAAAAIGVAVVAVKTLANAITEATANMQKMAATAKMLGVGLEGFSKISYAAKIAGVDTEVLQGSILHLQSVLKSSDKEAGRVFSSVGLSFEDLRKLPIDDAIGKIAQSLLSIKDPSEQAKAGLEIFGDQFPRLAGFLSKGEAGIAELSAEAKRLGFSLNGVQADSLKGVAENFRRLGSAWDGAKQQLAITLAPAIQAVTSFLIEIKSALSSLSGGWSDMGSKATAVIRGVVVALAWIADGIIKLQGLWYEYVTAPMIRGGAVVTDVISNIVDIFIEAREAFWDEFGEPIMATWEGIKEGVADLADWLSETWDEIVATFTSAWDGIKETASSVYEWLGQPIKDAIDAVAGWFSWLKDKISDAWNAIKNLFKRTKAGDAVRDVADNVEDLGKKMQGSDFAGKAKKAFDDLGKAADDAGDKVAKINPVDAIKAKLLSGIKDLESELRKAMENVGRTSAEVKIFDLKKSGASDAELEKVKKLAEDAKNVDIAFGNVKMPPLETYERSIKGLDTLLENGRLTTEQYKLGVLEASKALQEATGDGGNTKTAGANLKDSSAAVSATIKADLADQRQDPAAELKRAMAEAQEIRKKQLATAEATVKAIEALADDEWEGI